MVNPKRELTDEDVREIRRLYADGLAIWKLAKIYRTSDHFIREALSPETILELNHKRVRWHRLRLNRDKRAYKARHLHKSGMEITQIAEQLGVHRATIHRDLSRPITEEVG